MLTCRLSNLLEPLRQRNLEMRRDARIRRLNAHSTRKRREGEKKSGEKKSREENDDSDSDYGAEQSVATRGMGKCAGAGGMSLPLEGEGGGPGGADGCEADVVRSVLRVGLNEVL